MRPARWQKCLEENLQVDMTVRSRRKKLHNDVKAKAEVRPSVEQYLVFRRIFRVLIV